MTDDLKDRNIHYYFGEFDQKYLKYAKENLNLEKWTTLSGAGHRIINHHELIREIIKEHRL